MKLLTFAVVCLFSALASGESVEEFGFDWENLQPLNLYVDPIGPAPVSPGLKIVGGNVAARGAFPYQAALIIDSRSFCGGSIISNQWVLTAAHCVDTASAVQIIVGAHNPSTTINEPTQVRLVASGRVVHAEWTSSILLNDIALLRAASIPVGQPAVSIISLAPANSGTFAGQTSIVSGWGRTSDASNSISSELRYVEVPVTTNAVCANSYGSLVQPQHICTSGIGGLGSCNGDSGGPLVIAGVEVGIVSFGARLCEAGHPSAYARVSTFRNWITANSGV